MPSGVPHDEATFATFRAHFMLTRNASEAARQTGIPVTTGCDWARKLDADPAFVKECSEIRARRLEKLESQLERVTEKVVERIESADLTPEQLADIATSRNLKSFSYQNPKPQYLRGVVDFYKSVASVQARDRVAPDTGGPAVVIQLSGNAQVQVQRPQKEGEDPEKSEPTDSGS